MASTENDKGAVLVTGLMFLLLLMLLGTVAYQVSLNTVMISANYKSAREAFYQAEAGIHYGLAAMEAALMSGTAMPDVGNSMAIPGGAAPVGFSFVLSHVTRDGDNLYSFTSIGTGSHGAVSEIWVSFQKEEGIFPGFFGNTLVDLDPGSAYYSYDSGSVADPSPLDSTGSGGVASNVEINAGAAANGIIVDGDIIFGHNGLSDAGYTDPGKPAQTVMGDHIYVGYIDVDPLDLMGGPLTSAVAFHSAPSENMNDEELLGTTIHDGAITAPGDYYFTSITGDLTIDAFSGDINIWVRGGAHCIDVGSGETLSVNYGGTGHHVAIHVSDNGVPDNQNIIQFGTGSFINNNGKPTQFAIFTDSDAHIEFKNSTAVKALVYAPLGYVDMKNGGTFYGAAWADILDTNNSATLYYDTAISRTYLSNKLMVLSWKRK